jgi:hypothetical protein
MEKKTHEPDMRQMSLQEESNARHEARVSSSRCNHDYGLGEDTAVGKLSKPRDL